LTERFSLVRLIQVDVSVKTSDGNEYMRANRSSSRRGIRATTAVYLDPALASLPKDSSIVEYAPVDSPGEKVHAVSYARDGRGDIRSEMGRRRWARRSQLHELFP
jgi:hypothetical protein